VTLCRAAVKQQPAARRYTKKDNEMKKKSKRVIKVINPTDVYIDNETGIIRFEWNIGDKSHTVETKSKMEDAMLLASLASIIKIVPSKYLDKQ
jgi:hypothetical protein